MAKQIFINLPVKNKIKWIICSRGHRYQKSGDYSTCQICWPGQKKKIKNNLKRHK